MILQKDFHAPSEKSKTKQRLSQIKKVKLKVKVLNKVSRWSSVFLKESNDK